MTEVLEPQFVYARDPYSNRVITLCYRVSESTMTENFMAVAGIAMNRPNEQFSKKIGRKIAHGRMKSGNSLVFIPLKTVRKTERREEILQFIAGNTVDPSWDGFVDPLISRIMREHLWYRDIEAMIDKGPDSLMNVERPISADPLKGCVFGEIPPPVEDYVAPVTY